ncbi:MAG: DUF4845 domain-containing protein [Zoogloeaceae bacterium]|jgi:hypothetical protein|nr:DUF4845 domain-containing protein [Zoogloeaceae bacterium]
MQKRQRGITLTGAVSIGFIIILLVILTAKVVPPVTEYRLVRKVIGSTARDANAEGVNSENGVRAIFSRYAQVENINSVMPNDITVRRGNSGIIVAVKYDRKIHLFSNASLLLEFAVESSGK